MNNNYNYQQRTAPEAETRRDSSLLNERLTDDLPEKNIDTSSSNFQSAKAKFEEPHREGKLAYAGERAQAAADVAGDKISSAASTAKADLTYAKDVTAEKVGDAAEATKNNLVYAKDVVVENAVYAKDVAAEKLAAAGQTAVHAKDVVVENAVYAKDVAADKLASAGHTIADNAAYAKERVVSAKDSMAHATAESLRYAADKIDPFPKEGAGLQPQQFDAGSLNDDINQPKTI